MAIALGNSPHLCGIIARIEGEKPTILGWRKLGEAAVEQYSDSISGAGKRIYLVGYDYGSYAKSYNQYLDVNVLNPVRFVRQALELNPDCEIIYINTKTGTKETTFSRYYYAKQRLASELSQCTGCYCISVNTIVDGTGKSVVSGGLMSRLAFALLGKLGRLETTSLDEIEKALVNYRDYPCAPNSVRGVALQVPRSQFVDRLLRMLLG